MTDDNSIPLSWILLFLALVFAVGAGAVFFVGGSLIPAGGEGVVALPAFY